MRRDIHHGRACRPAAGAVLALAGAMLLPGFAAAQKQPAGKVGHPQLQVVMPPGAKAGTTVEVTLTGLDLDEPEALAFSHEGITAEAVPEPPPPKPDPKKPKPPTPPTNPVYRFKVTVAADTPPGNHDVRLVTKRGVSNPRAFVVGDLSEAVEKEPNNDVKEAQRVELNTTVSGAVTASADVDYFVFAGKEGQRVVVSCLTSSIDSRLQAAVELYDAKGKQLGLNRNYRQGDALVDCTLPADGDYYVRVHDFTYTSGDPEHFYRLSITTAPWIDAVFPAVVEPGKPARLTVYGRNLPGGKPDPSAVVDGRVLERAVVTLDVPEDPKALHRLAYRGHVPAPASGLDGFEYRLTNDVGTSNPFLLTFARAPVVLDAGDNDRPEAAQEVTLPCEIAGRIEKKRDRDWYAFTARKGDVYSIEAYGDRLGAPVDLYFLVRDAKGRTLVELDDNQEVLGASQFFTRSEDPPRYRFVAPADGRYQLMVSSRESYIQASPRDFYRVRITAEEPDFRLVVMPPAPNAPDACVLHPGGRQYFSVFVWRQDGFNGEITLAAEGLPPGVVCPPQVVGAGVRQATFVLSAGPDAEPWTGTVRVKGTAIINGQEVVRQARPATITWPVPQQNVPTLSRLDRSLVLGVRADRALFALNANRDKITAAPGDKTAVNAKLTRASSDVNVPVQVTALNLPPNLTFNNNNQPLTIPPGRDEITVLLNVRDNVAPGDYAIVLRGQAQVPVTRGPNKQKVNVLVSEASAPILLSIRPKLLAKLAVEPNVRVAAGKEKEVVVRVTRMYDFGGEFKVDLVVPDKLRGKISAEEVTLAPGQNEAHLMLKADEDVRPGGLGNLVVRARAMFKEVEVSQEAKFNVEVTAPKKEK